MGHVRYKLTIIIVMLFTLLSCKSERAEDHIIKLLEENYANLYINHVEEKREALRDFKEYLKTHSLNDDQNLQEIHTKINKMYDGHIILYDSRKEKNINYSSGIKFIPGSPFVKECDSCEPKIIEDKYEIIDINQRRLNDFFEKEKFSVPASTLHGRYFRIIRLLEKGPFHDEITLTLKSSTGKMLSTKIKWKQVVGSAHVCVSSERLTDNIFKLNIYSLWCDNERNGYLSDEKILANFKSQLDAAMEGAMSTDKFIIDLRENGGGGEFEVEYVLNTFFDKSVFVSNYKYLRKSHPGLKKNFERFWPFKLGLWSPEESDVTRPQNKPKKTFYTNKIVTLISAGCFSSCEIIASVLKSEKRSFILGSTTHGGSGDPVPFHLKGTPFSINLPTSIVFQKDGSPYEGLGVAPQKELFQNANEKGDTILENAIDLIQ